MYLPVWPVSPMPKVFPELLQPFHPEKVKGKKRIRERSNANKKRQCGLQNTLTHTAKKDTSESSLGQHGMAMHIWLKHTQNSTFPPHITVGLLRGFVAYWLAVWPTGWLTGWPIEGQCGLLGGHMSYWHDLWSMEEHSTYSTGQVQDTWFSDSYSREKVLQNFISSRHRPNRVQKQGRGGNMQARRLHYNGTMEEKKDKKITLQLLHISRRKVIFLSFFFIIVPF